MEINESVIRLLERMSQRFYGKYRGIVKDNEDPKKIGRIKALVPEVLNDVVSGWALPCAHFGGDGEGQYTVPSVESGVWIEFEAGDVSRPIWSGCWWKEDTLPEDADGNRAAPPLKIIRSSEGLMVTLDDNRQTIMVSDKDGSNMLKIQVKDKKVTLKSADKVFVEGSKVEVKASEVVVDSSRIELVKGAAHPVVFGDQLLQYLTQAVTMLNAHMHPGELALGIFSVTPAPPAPQLQPPKNTMLSKKVKTG